MHRFALLLIISSLFSISFAQTYRVLVTPSETDNLNDIRKALNDSRDDIKQKELLPDLEIIYQDDLVPSLNSSEVEERPYDAIIGQPDPSKTDINVPVLATKDNNLAVDDAAKPLIVYVKPTYTALGRAVSRMFLELHWSTVVLIPTIDQDGVEMVQSDCSMKYLAVEDSFAGMQTGTVQVRPLQSGASAGYVKILQEASMEANVLIMCTETTEAEQEIMIAAEQLKMTTSGNYTFINIGTMHNRSSPWSAVAVGSNSASLEDTYMSVKFIVPVGLTSQQVPAAIRPYYDALQSFAYAVNQTLQSGVDPRDTKALIDTIWNGTMGSILFNEGKRVNDYAVMDMGDGTDAFQEKRKYNNDGTTDNLAPYSWPNGSPTVNEPVCGYDGSQCHAYVKEVDSVPERQHTAAIVLVILVIVIVVGSIGWVFYKRRSADPMSEAFVAWNKGFQYQPF